MGAAFLIDKRENRHLNRQHVQESLPTGETTNINFQAIDLVQESLPTGQTTDNNCQAIEHCIQLNSWIPDLREKMK